MVFEKKLNKLYEEQGLFTFLAKHTTGEFSKIAVKRTEPIYLKELDFIKKHLDSDLEDWYVRQLINLIMQEELKALLPVFELIKIDIEDVEENIIFTKSKNYYKNATTFYCPVEEDICIAKNVLHVDDTDLVLGSFEYVDLPTYGENVLTAFMWYGVEKTLKK